MRISRLLLLTGLVLSVFVFGFFVSQILITKNEKKTAYQFQQHIHHPKKFGNIHDDLVYNQKIKKKITKESIRDTNLREKQTKLMNYGKKKSKPFKSDIKTFD